MAKIPCSLDENLKEKMKPLKKIAGMLVPFLFAASTAQAMTNYVRKPVQQPAQQQQQENTQEKQETQPKVGTYKLIFYQTQDIHVMNEKGKLVADKKGKPVIVERISRDASKAYQLSLDNIYELTVRKGDRIHFYKQSENWNPGEKHLAYDPTLKKLKTAIYVTFNGKDFNPEKIREGQKICLVDFDKNKLIVFDEATYRTIKKIPDFYQNPIEIKGNQAYLLSGENKTLIGKTRGTLLTPEQALGIIDLQKKEAKQKESLEEKVKKDDKLQKI